MRYTAPLRDIDTLESIYQKFNIDHPADFKGHSLSVSDVVVLRHGDRQEAHYCDDVGFQEVPEFFAQQEQRLTPDALLTGEQVQTPRGSFHVTNMTREQMEAAGYGFHHQSEDGKYFIMGNGTNAYAVAVQRENPLRTAELSTEQNENMIDGVLNNTPSPGEAEAKEKAGEPVVAADTDKGKESKPKKPHKATQKKPSIRAQLKAAKDGQQQKPPAKEKSQDLEV